MALAETRAASDALRTLLVALAPLRSAANLFHVDTLDQLLLSTNNQNKSLGQASKIEIWLLFHLKVILTLKYPLPAAALLVILCVLSATSPMINCFLILTLFQSKTVTALDRSVGADRLGSRRWRLWWSKWRRVGSKRGRLLWSDIRGVRGTGTGWLYGRGQWWSVAFPPAKYFPY